MIPRTLLPLILLGLCSSMAFADEDENSDSTEEGSASVETNYSKPNSIALEFQVQNARQAAQKLDSLLQSQGSLVLHREEGSSYKWASTQSVIAKLKLSQLELLEKNLSPMGERLSRLFEGSDVSENLASLELQKKQAKAKLETYSTELARYKGMEDARYQRIWDEVRAMEERLQNLDLQISAVQKNADMLEATITLKEERPTSASADEESVKYVNMPGVEYTLLSVENPKAGLSSHYYKGYGLKYVFTRGKSNISVSPLYADPVAEGDSTQVQEIMLYSFGQDFYPLHKNKGPISFLNMYTGYDLGGMLTTFKDHSSNHWFANVNLGLELFKTSRLLIDVRGSYFLPFYQNHNLRGFLSRASINYVF